MPLTPTAVATGDAYPVGTEDAVMAADLAYRASALADCCASVSRSGTVRTYRVSLHSPIWRYSATGFSSPRTTPTRGTRLPATATTCSDFTFLYTVRARSSAAPGRPIRTSSMSSSVSSRHAYNPSRTAIAISAAARRAPRSFRQVRSSIYGWRTSRTRPRPASTDTGPLGRSARSLAVIWSASSGSFSTTSSVEVISSASAASSGCRRSNSDSRTDRS